MCHSYWCSIWLTRSLTVVDMETAAVVVTVGDTVEEEEDTVVEVDMAEDTAVVVSLAFNAIHFPC